MQGRRGGGRLVCGQDLMGASAVRVDAEIRGGEVSAPVGHTRRGDQLRVRRRDAAGVERLPAAG